MRTFYSAVIFLLSCTFFTGALLASESHAGYSVKYAGGSIPMMQNGRDLVLFVDSDQVRLQDGRRDAAVIPASAISEITHGEEIHRRFAKVLHLSATKEYIGLTWDKGSVVLDVNKDEYRGILLALEGVSGKKTDNKDPHIPNKVTLRRG